MKTKICRDCKTAKPLEQFSPSKKNRDGRTSYCRECMQVRSRASYRKRMGERGRSVREPLVIPEGQRRCPDCKEIKPLDAFSRNRGDAHGRGNYCKPCHNARSAETRERLYGGGREYHLRARYGIGQADVDVMLEAQGHKCAVCKKADPEHVDHDHATGKVRGMLCFNCNQALGNARDDIGVLRELIGYLYRAAGARHRILAEELRFDESAGLEYQPIRHGPPAPDPSSPLELVFARYIAASRPHHAGSEPVHR